MGLAVHFLLLFFHSLAFDFFSYENKITLRPSTEVTDEKQLFGWQIRFSPSDKAFYVSALNTIFKTETATQKKLTDGGMIYKCADPYEGTCVPWIVPWEFIREDTPKIRRLFGYSFLLGEEDSSITVCAPNSPYLEACSTLSFCMKYNRATRVADKTKAFPTIDMARCKATTDNYGTKIEKIIYGSSDGTPRYMVSQYNCVSQTIRGDITEYAKFVSVEKEGGIKSDIPAKSIPSPEFILNEADDLVYLILVYPFTNHLRGSFEVFTNDLFPHQYVELSVGSAGQLFGYSSTLGKFSESSCGDIVVSAPLHNIEAEEGVVYHFKCNSITNKFEENPTLLYGDKTKFGNFGFAVANLKDSNKDGFEDIIILQPNYLRSYPVLYIYTPGKNGFSDIPAKKIALEYSPAGTYSEYAYGLYSGFDWNDDQVNDVAVLYPAQNKVFVIPGLRFTLITMTVSLTTLNANEPEDIENVEVPASMGKSYYKISMKTCFKLEHLNAKDLDSNIHIKIKHVITTRPYSFFNDNNEFKPRIDEDIPVTDLFQDLCRTYEILFLNYPMPDSPHIVMETTATVEIDTNCRSSCIRPDALVQINHIKPDFWRCNQAICKVQFGLRLLSDIPTLVMGNVNPIKIKVELENIGDVISSFPSISMKVPKSFTTKTFSFRDTTGATTVTSLRHKDKILADDVTQFDFIAVKVFTSGQKIILDVDVEAVPEYGTVSIDVVIEAFDAMSKPVHFSSFPMKLLVSKISMLFKAASTPEKLSVIKESDTEARMTETLKYIIQVTNQMTAAFFKLPIIKIDLQLELDGKEIFTVARLTAQYSISKIDCNSQLIGGCSPNIFYFSVPHIKPMDVLDVEVALSKTAYTGLLVDRNVTMIDAKITLFHETLEGLIETITVSTQVSGRIKPSKTIAIIAICVSVSVGIILLSILVFISFKMKLMDKIKTAASK